MKRHVLILTLFLACPGVCFAQASGNIGYSQSAGSARAEQAERSKRALSREEMPPTATSMFVDASILMNVKAEEYVAVFGVAQEGSTVAECSQKMDVTLSAFVEALKGVGVGASDLFVDFAAQNKIYDFQVTGDIAKERLAGFELKKNVSIHYRDKMLLDRLVVVASQSQIYDLIKVDYIVGDTLAVQNRLMEEAARIIKQKTARYERLFGIRLQHPAQIYAEKSSIYYPTEMYDSYTAFETEDLTANYYRQKYTIQGARKSRTFFFNALTAKLFDTVINPVVIEPVVQFTLYVKMKYSLEPPKTTRKTEERNPGRKARDGRSAASAPL